MRVLIVLTAIIAFLLPTPGILLAASELSISRNLPWGSAMLVACLLASLSALFWAFSALQVWKFKQWIWVFTYVFACLFAITASENIVFKFMM